MSSVSRPKPSLQRATTIATKSQKYIREHQDCQRRLEEHRTKQIYQQSREVCASLVFRSREASLLFASADAPHRSITLWRYYESSGSLERLTKTPEGFSGASSFLAVLDDPNLPSADLFFSSSSGTISLWDAHSILSPCSPTSPIVDAKLFRGKLCLTSSICSVPNTSKSLVGTESGALFLLGCHQDGIASEHCFFHQDKKISAVSASQTDPNVFVSASHDGTVTLWDKRSTEPAHFIDPFNLTASCSLDTPPLLSKKIISSVDLSSRRDGHALVTSMSLTGDPSHLRGATSMIDIRTFKPIKTTVLASCPKKTRIHADEVYTITSDGKLYRWDVKSNEQNFVTTQSDSLQILDLICHPESHSSSPDRIIIGGRNIQVHDDLLVAECFSI